MLEEALLCCKVISPEHPPGRKKSSSAIFRSAYDGFVDLNNMPDAANGLRFRDRRFRAKNCDVLIECHCPHPSFIPLLGEASAAVFAAKSVKIFIHVVMSERNELTVSKRAFY